MMIINLIDQVKLYFFVSTFMLMLGNSFFNFLQLILDIFIENSNNEISHSSLGQKQFLGFQLEINFLSSILLSFK